MEITSFKASFQQPNTAPSLSKHNLFGKMDQDQLQPLLSSRTFVVVVVDKIFVELLNIFVYILIKLKIF